MPAKKSITVEFWFELLRCRISRNRVNKRKRYAETSHGYYPSKKDARRCARLFRLGKELTEKEIRNLRYRRRGTGGFTIVRRAVLASKDNGGRSDYRFGNLLEVTKKVKIPLYY